MIDKAYLDNLLSGSIHSEQLENILGIERDPFSGKVDYGHFEGLDGGCSISIGIQDDLPKPPNAPAESFVLKDTDIEKICQILNDNNFSAVTSQGAADASKILVTNGGIQLPYQKAEDAVAQLADIMDVIKENGYESRGFAHPLSKEAMVPSRIGDRNIVSAKITEFDAEKNEILVRNGATYDEMVSQRLEEVKNNSLSSEALGKMVEEKEGVSVYRGGTLGDKPFAVIGRTECKDFVYASPDFYMAAPYAIDYNRGYVAPNGERYGFVYEYSVTENQKYTCDYGLENRQSRFTGAGGYETSVYPHQNKVKGIYLKTETGIMRIADEKGYISKQWEDFAKLHNPVASYDNINLVDRANAIIQASENDTALASYQKRNYDAGMVTAADLEKRCVSSDSRRSVQFLTGRVANQEIIDMPYSFVLKNADIKGIDLRDKKVILCDKFSFDKDTKLSVYDLTFRDVELSAGMDLSNVKEAVLSGNIKVGEDVKLPQKLRGKSVSFVDSQMPNGSDLKQFKYVEFTGNTHIGADVLFSDVTLSDAVVTQGDFSKAKKLSMKGDVVLSKGVKLPENLSAYDLESLTIHSSDFSQIKELSCHTLPPIVLLDENGKKECIINSNGRYTPIANDLKDLKEYPSIDSYRKCKAVEEKMTAMGIDKDSYMLLTKEHKAHLSYGNNEVRSLETTFKESAEELRKAGGSFVYGGNNGVTAAYFKEDVYLISNNPDLPNKLYTKGKNVGLGVATSNGEKFMLPSGEPDNKLNRLRENMAQWSPQFQETTPARAELKADMVEQAKSASKKLEQQTTKLTSSQAVKTVNKEGEKLATKVAMKSAVAEALKAEEKTLGKTVVDVVKKADGAVNEAIDATIEKGSQALNNSKAGKLYEKVSTKIANSSVGKAVSAVGKTITNGVKTAAKKTVQVASKVMPKVAGTAAKKVAAKTGAKAVGKSLLKKIPLVSVGAGAYFAYDRIKNGEYKAAACEMLSGVAGCFPGLGTAASTAIDVGLAGNDIKNAVNADAKQTAETKKVPTEAEAKKISELRGVGQTKAKAPVKQTTLDVTKARQQAVARG